MKLTSSSSVAAAALRLLVPAATKPSRSCFDSACSLSTINRNVLVSRLKGIVCYRPSSSFRNPLNKNNHYFPLFTHCTQEQKRSGRQLTSAQFSNTPTDNNTNIIMASKKRVCIIGSGNWGSAIAKITGNNVRSRTTLFETQINMYVYEEVLDGKKLTEIINTTHENVKYLPGIKLPENVVAVPDVVEATSGADILVFVLPHQFVSGICKTIKGKIKADAIAVSLIKGFDTSDGGIKLLSKVISESLDIECAVLMGANLAHEVASEAFCESTIGAANKETGNVLKSLFDADYFRCSVVTDAHTVEACGALKNVVAVGSGITDGLNMGDNTKAAVLRLGMMEMIDFINMFFKGAKLRTFFESSGLADLVTTCHGGRNRKLGEALVKTKKTVPELEKEILNGQSFQGPPTAKEVYAILKEKDMLDQCPMFVAVHLICQREMEPSKFIDLLKNHPEYKAN